MNLDPYWACQKLVEYTLTVQLSPGATGICDTTSLTGNFASLGWVTGQGFEVQTTTGYRTFYVSSPNNIALTGVACQNCPP
jgi:hypothetical protein